MTVFDRPKRRRTVVDDSGPTPAPSASQRLEAVEAESRRSATILRWALRGATALLTAGLAAAGAFYGEWRASTEQRGVDRHRLVVVERDLAVVVERDLAELRAELGDLRTTFYSLFPVLLNPPARQPASTGDDR